MMTKIADKMMRDQDLRVYHDGWKGGCEGERGEAEEACGQEYDGGAESYGGIL